MELQDFKKFGVAYEHEGTPCFQNKNAIKNNKPLIFKIVCIDLWNVAVQRGFSKSKNDFIKT